MTKYFSVICLMALVPFSAFPSLPPSLSFAPFLEKATPAVVNIYANRIVKNKLRRTDPFFGDFFKDLIPFGAPKNRVERSLGSGVLLDPSGLVVTNTHVIAGAQEIRVVTAARREYEARVLLSDPHTDLAVLRLKTHRQDFPWLPLGDSDTLRVGDVVLAIGNPFGVGQTVTSGIVSALSRTTGRSSIQSFIQTDASINPGNSGGALLGPSGSVMGINAEIFSKSGGSLGIGFSIPSNLVGRVLDSARGGKTHMVWPWVGFSGQPMTDALAKAMSLDSVSGVLVNNVVPQHPFGALHPEDVILEVEGHPVEDMPNIRFRFALKGVGHTAHLTLLRQGKKKTLILPLVAPPEIPPRKTWVIKEPNTPLSGATVVNLSPAVNDSLHMRPGTRGVVITSVAQGSLAERFQFRPSDIIRMINGHTIGSVADLRMSLSIRPSVWRLHIRRGGQTLSLVFR